METGTRVRVRRKRSALRRFTKPFRRIVAQSRMKVAVASMTVLAAAGGAAALALLLSGPRPEPAVAASPPLALSNHGLRPINLVSPAGVAVTTRLVIPTVGIDLSVVQGDGVSVPVNLALHYPGTDQPGGGSNALYYAHARPGMFQGIYQLHKGDEIRAIRADGTEQDYHVAAMEYVPYNDLSVLKATPYDQITLLTCTSYNPTTPRYIVIGLPGAGSS